VQPERGTATENCGGDAGFLARLPRNILSPEEEEEEKTTRKTKKRTTPIKIRPGIGLSLFSIPIPIRNPRDSPNDLGMKPKRLREAIQNASIIANFSKGVKLPEKRGWHKKPEAALAQVTTRAGLPAIVPNREPSPIQVEAPPGPQRSVATIDGKNRGQGKPDCPLPEEGT